MPKGPAPFWDPLREPLLPLAPSMKPWLGAVKVRGNWTPMGIVYLSDKLSHAVCSMTISSYVLFISPPIYIGGGCSSSKLANY